MKRQPGWRFSGMVTIGVLLLLNVSGCGGEDDPSDSTTPLRTESSSETAASPGSPGSPAAAPAASSPEIGTKYEGTWSVQPPLPAPPVAEGAVNRDVEQIEIPLEYPRSVHWSPDGSRVVVAGSGLVILNALDRKIQHRLGGDERWAAAFSRDGSRLAVLQTENAEIAFLDPATGQGAAPVIRVPPHTLDVAWSPDGRMLATVGGEYNSPLFTLWEAGSGKKVHELDYTGESLDQVFFTADGQHVMAFGGNDRAELLLWDVVTGQQTLTYTTPKSWPESLALSPDGRWLAASANEHHAPDLRLWALEDPESVRMLTGHDGNVTSLSFTPDSNWLISGASDGMIRLWNREAMEHVRPLQGHLDGIAGLDVSPDGRWIASVDRSAVVRFWHIDEALQNPERYSTTGEEQRSLDTGDVSGMAISDSGHRMVTNSTRGILVWDVPAGRILHTIEDESTGGSRVGISPDGSRFAWTRDYGGIDVHETESGRKLYNLRLKRGDVTPGARDIRGPFFQRDGKAAAAAVDGSIVVWDVAEGKVTLDDVFAEEQIEALAVFPDGKRVAVAAGESGVIRIFDLGGQPATKPLHELQGHEGEIRALAVSSDGRLLASAELNKSGVRVWNTETGELMRTIDVRYDRIKTLLFLPGSTTLCSRVGSEDFGSPIRLLSLWDAGSGKQLRTLRGHTDWIVSLGATSDGRTLFSASSDGTVKQWHVGEK